MTNDLDKLIKSAVKGGTESYKKYQNNKRKKEKELSFTARQQKQDQRRKLVLSVVLIFLMFLAGFFLLSGSDGILSRIIFNKDKETLKQDRPKIYTGLNEDYKEPYRQDGILREGTTDAPFNYYNIPEFNGTTPYYVLNNNRPYFDTELDPSSKIRSFEKYPPLDELGRVRMCDSIVGTDLMPKEKRGKIGHVKPSGWKQARYDDLIKDKYLYNRCHLIGFQLAGENDNERNLMTGTRFFNVDGMLPFENEVTEYVKDTDNHVRYRITPIFIDDELVARGIIMEGYSLEDNGEGICFNVFVYNNQPGVVIDYSDGSSARK